MTCSAILTEMVPLPGRGDSAALVIGIGINLAIPADRLPTEQSTSLQLHVQGLPDARTLRDMIAAHIVRSLSSRLSGFVADPHAAAERLREETSRVCWTLGRRVEARCVTMRAKTMSCTRPTSAYCRCSRSERFSIRKV